MDVENLRVYKLSLELMRRVYGFATGLPREERKLRSQLKDSAGAIPPLIAEGFGRKNSQRDFRRYVQMAMGESDEVISHLRKIEILCLTNNLELCQELIGEYKSLSKQLNKLSSAVKSNLKSDV